MLRRGYALGLLLALAASVAPRSAWPAQASQARRKVPPDWPFEPPSPAKSVEIGNFYFRRHDYRGALSRYLEAVHSNPDYAPAYLALGKVYEVTGKRRAALAAYEKYLAELPSDQDAERAKGVQKAIKRLKREVDKSK